MALRADGIPAWRIKLRRLHHVRFLRNVLGPWPMTTLTCNSVLGKRWVGVSIHCPIDGLGLAGMAPQAVRFDRTGPSQRFVFFVARRGIPGVTLGVPRKWRLIEIAIAADEIAAPVCS